MPKITEATSAQVQKLQDAQATYIEWMKAEAEQKQLVMEQRVIADVVTAQAQADLIFVIIKGHLTADLQFGSGQKMHFDGWPWGVGAYGGTGYGLYYGVDAAVLAGGCSYQAQGAADTGGILQITFWRDLDNFGALGQINVAVAGIGAGETGGNDGQWTFA